MSLTSLVTRSFLGVCFLAYSFGANAQTHPALGGGTGTSTDPYQIQTPDHLKQLADFVNAGYGDSTAGVYYIVINDLDLTAYAAGAGWNPIGNNSSSSSKTCFQGKFNGNGKKVTNLKINRQTVDVGLFGRVIGATVINLGVENDTILNKFTNSSSFTGGVAGYIYANSTISNCYSKGTIISSSSSTIGGASIAGGIVGYTQSSIISNCYSTVSISSFFTGNGAGWASAGGITGTIMSSNVSNCYSTDSINCSSTTDAYAGGVVGFINGPSNGVSNCVAINSKISCIGSTRYLGRVTGNDNGYSSGTKNYALDSMIIIDNGVLVTSITDNLNTKNGMGKPIDTLQNLAFYATAGNWWNITAWDINDPNGVWKICDGKSLPFLRWQGIVCTPTTYTITATAGTGGSINPSGVITVNAGEDKTFTFSENNSNYAIVQVFIDDTNNPAAVAAGSYTFTNVSANHKIEVYFKPTVGIVGAGHALPLPRIYPNPTTGQLRVSGDIWDNGDREIRIFNVVGQVVFTSQLSKLSPETTIDISHLSAGLYFLKVDGKMVKVVKE